MSIIKQINKLYSKHNEGYIAISYSDNKTLDAIHVNYIGEKYKEYPNDICLEQTRDRVICHVGIMEGLENNTSITKTEYEFLMFTLKDYSSVCSNEPEFIKNVCSVEQTSILKLSTQRITNE